MDSGFADSPFAICQIFGQHPPGHPSQSHRYPFLLDTRTQSLTIFHSKDVQYPDQHHLEKFVFRVNLHSPNSSLFPESSQSFLPFLQWSLHPRSVHRKKATWISAQIDVFLCSRSNVYAISSASFNATRPFCFMLVTVQRASTLVPTYVLSNVTHLPSLQRPSQENISSKIGLILSFSLILIWGARLPVVCGSSAFNLILL